MKAVSVITPSFIACTQAELIDHYRKVADHCPCRSISNNIPARTGTPSSPPPRAQAARSPEHHRTKDSAGSQESLDGFLAIARERDDFDVHVGPDSLVLHGLKNGAGGLHLLLLGSATWRPSPLNTIHTSFVKGDLAAAERHRRASAPCARNSMRSASRPPLSEAPLRHAAP